MTLPQKVRLSSQITFNIFYLLISVTVGFDWLRDLEKLAPCL